MGGEWVIRKVFCCLLHFRSQKLLLGQAFGDVTFAVHTKRSRLFRVDDQGHLHRFVRLFVNGDEVPRNAPDQPVVEDDRVEILAAAAGG